MMNDIDHRIRLQGIRYLSFLGRIMKEGVTICPRGSECREMSDIPLYVDPCYPFMTFKDRHYDIDYFRKEMRWKLGANRYDRSIATHAKLWGSVVNPDGTYNSNYGQYWFGEQMGIWIVVNELIRDRDSRRAVIPMLNASHMSPQTVDTVCTECVGFRIRPLPTLGEPGLRLDMSVHMRSSDVIFGLGTDIPTFAFLYRLVFGLLVETYPTLVFQDGLITILSMSSHIYERHYELVDMIVGAGWRSYVPESMPVVRYGREAMSIIASRGQVQTLASSELGSWLCRDAT